MLFLYFIISNLLYPYKSNGLKCCTINSRNRILSGTSKKRTLLLALKLVEQLQYFHKRTRYKVKKFKDFELNKSALNKINLNLNLNTDSIVDCFTVLLTKIIVGFNTQSNKRMVEA
jgi:hypothetical protein